MNLNMTLPAQPDSIGAVLFAVTLMVVCIWFARFITILTINRAYKSPHLDRILNNGLGYQFLAIVSTIGLSDFWMLLPVSLSIFNLFLWVRHTITAITFSKLFRVRPSVTPSLVTDTVWMSCSVCSSRVSIMRYFFCWIALCPTTHPLPMVGFKGFRSFSHWLLIPQVGA